jgi:entericidin B
MKEEVTMARKLVAVLSLIGMAFGLVACNTVEGVGKDVKATGQAIEKAADKNKTY